MNRAYLLNKIYPLYETFGKRPASCPLTRLRIDVHRPIYDA
jgi:hypothetical protein